jgi:small subunit ribosomal protein S6
VLNKYELTVLLHPDLEIDLDSCTKKLEQLISDAKGKVVEREDWGKRKLAYPVKNQQFAVYVFYVLELEPGSVAGLERELLITDEVIRHLIVKYDEALVAAKLAKAAKEAQTEDEDKKPESKPKSAKTQPASTQKEGSE